MERTQYLGMTKIIVIVIILVICSSIAFAAQTKESSEYRVSYQTGSGITTFSNNKISVVMGEQGIGNYTDTNFKVEYGILYMLKDLSVFYTTPMISGLFTLMIEDWGIEWMRINWT